MSGCCNEYRCERRKPFMFYVGPFTNRWLMATDYTERTPGHFTANRKHDVHDQLVGALLAAGWTPPPEGQLPPEMKGDDTDA